MEGVCCGPNSGVGAGDAGIVRGQDMAEFMAFRVIHVIMCRHGLGQGAAHQLNADCINYMHNLSDRTRFPFERVPHSLSGDSTRNMPVQD